MALSAHLTMSKNLPASSDCQKPPKKLWSPKRPEATPKRNKKNMSLSTTYNYNKRTKLGYYTYMVKQTVSGGVAHKLPSDLRKALVSAPKALAAWEDITPLARNEWICWVVSVKNPETRRNHIERTITELREGKRRPCCWLGCVHRKDKALSASQKYVLRWQSRI